MKTLSRLGCLLPLLLLSLPAQADTFRLTLMIYTTDTGHRLDLGSYLASFRLGGYETVTECETAGQMALTSFKSQVVDGARLMPAFVCERTP